MLDWCAMEVKCGLCNSERTKILSNLDNFQIIKCLACKVYFTNPQPKGILKTNVKFYKIDRFNYLGAKDQLSRRSEEIITRIKKYKDTGKLLEIGSSYGFFLNVAKDNGFDVCGVEISPDAVNYSQKKFGLKVFKGTLVSASLPSSNFDAVVMMDVLEHLTDPRRELQSVSRVLKRGGLLVIQVPNFESVMAKITGSKWNWLLIPIHLFHFSPHSLEKFIKLQDFKILELRTYDRIDELVNNTLDVLSIRRKNDLISRFFYKLSRLFLHAIYCPASFIWCYFGKGSLIQVYAQK